MSAALVVCSLGAGYGSSATADRWVVTDVAKLASLAYPAYRYVSFVGTSSDGRIFWLADGSRSRNLFEWQNGTISELGPVPFAFGVVNDKGAVAGSDFAGSLGPVGQTVTHTYLWRGGAVTKLGTFGGFATVAGLNDRGQVAETYAPPEDPSSIRAAIWQNGQTTDLGTLGGKGAWADALNDREQVVGISRPASGFDHAFLWDRGKMIDLRTPGNVSEAEALNERGQVVGWWGRANPGGFRSAFLWQRGKAVDLGPVSMDGNLPIAVSEHGWVIRSTGLQFGSGRGVLWHDGRTVDLGGIGGGQTFPLAINKRGQIVGTASLHGGTYQKPRLRAFLLESGKMTVLPGAVSYYNPKMTIDPTGTRVVAGTCCPDLLLLWTRRPA